MRTHLSILLALFLCGQASFTHALSGAPLQALSAYIENTPGCSPQLVEWNKKYIQKTLDGETPRNFYYRVLNTMDWGRCGRPFFKFILEELQKAWLMRFNQMVSEAEYETKEAELISLFFAALEDGKQGEQRVRDYEASAMGRLLAVKPERQYFDCMFFGKRLRCMD
jgi:hypothetical protein